MFQVCSLRVYVSILQRRKECAIQEQEPFPEFSLIREGVVWDSSIGLTIALEVFAPPTTRVERLAADSHYFPVLGITRHYVEIFTYASKCFLVFCAIMV
jgi:hypothetical protein